MGCLLNIPFPEVVEPIRKGIPSIFITAHTEQKHICPVAEGRVDHQTILGDLHAQQAIAMGAELPRIIGHGMAYREHTGCHQIHNYYYDDRFLHHCCLPLSLISLYLLYHALGLLSSPRFVKSLFSPLRSRCQSVHSLLRS